MKIFCPSAAGSCIACWCALLVATAFGWTSPAGAALSAVPERTFATNGPVTAVLPLGDKIFLGGSFSELGLRTGPGVALSRGTGEPVGNVAEVTEASDGRVPEVDAVIADGRGGWYIGGTFERVGGASVKTLAHVRADGLSIRTSRLAQGRTRKF